MQMVASTSSYPQGPGYLCVMPSHEPSFGLMWIIESQECCGYGVVPAFFQGQFLLVSNWYYQVFSSQPLTLTKPTRDHQIRVSAGGFSHFYEQIGVLGPQRSVLVSVHYSQEPL